jgi:hypothetical protein
VVPTETSADQPKDIDWDCTIGHSKLFPAEEHAVRDTVRKGEEPSSWKFLVEARLERERPYKAQEWY